MKKQRPASLNEAYLMKGVIGRCAICLWAGLSFAATVHAIEGVPTVGIYDEPAQINGVDFVAPGSTLDLAQFTVDLAAAFGGDHGGVYQCDAIGDPLILSYGAARTKLFTLMRGEDTTLGVTTGSSLQQPISGNSLWISINPQMTFLFDGAVSGIPGEGVVAFGLTILSRSGFGSETPLGEVTATARFSGGGTATSGRQISESAGLGDTFYGFRAPEGQSILSVTFASVNGYSFPFDDIGFMTAVVPEPPISLLAACGLSLGFGWRAMRQRRRSRITPKPKKSG